jgi:hypothetical protein
MYPPSEGLIAPTQILESALELYYMDEDSDFFKPSHESRTPEFHVKCLILIWRKFQMSLRLTQRKFEKKLENA